MIHERWGRYRLYQKIAIEIRSNILNGVYQPGDRLPAIRELKQQRNCAQGTIQRAYNELVLQGLVISQAGKGTHVVNQLDYENLQFSVALRKWRLVHRAESFLLESLIDGNSFEEIEESMELARRHMLTF